MLNARRDVERGSLLDVARRFASLLHAQSSFLHIDHLTGLVAVPLRARAGVEMIAVHADVGRTPGCDRASEVGGIECLSRWCTRSLLSCVYPHARDTQSKNSKEHEGAAHVAIL